MEIINSEAQMEGTGHKDVRKDGKGPTTADRVGGVVKDLVDVRKQACLMAFMP